jgi:type IV pilus assembly protein PilV
MKALLPFSPSGRPRLQQGTTLLEVLISIVVLSVGLLGYAGLQTLSMKNNTSAFQRSQATILTYDIVDRIRANRPNLASYNVGLGAVGTYADVISWKNNVAASLPDGKASVEIPNPAPGQPYTATITIQWDDNRDGTDPIQFITETAL